MTPKFLARGRLAVVLGSDQPVRRRAASRGSIHPRPQVTPAGVALGALDAWMWARQPKDQLDIKETGLTQNAL